MFRYLIQQNITQELVAHVILLLTLFSSARGKNEFLW